VKCFDTVGWASEGKWPKKSNPEVPKGFFEDSSLTCGKHGTQIIYTEIQWLCHNSYGLAGVPAISSHYTPSG